uniref:Vang-like protein 2 n=1 Tax=Aceria tosichella TaxID=561515 RepID=A0A6G1SJL0_9ACAR
MDQEQQQQQQQEQQQQQQQPTNYLNQRPVQENRLAPILSSRPTNQNESNLVNGNYWPSADVQPQMKSQPMFGSTIERQVTMDRPIQQRPRAPASDRDSVSTLSRFNQLDDRRSFTMRSQYTANALNKSNRRFGFVELTSEAFRQLMGFGGDNKLTVANRQSQSPISASLIANEQLRQNLSLSVSGATSATTTAGAGLDQAQKFGGGAGAKVTVIDSGDERQFGREVLSYRLTIMRLLNLLLSAIVLLSPVVMLLLPKMEPLIRATQEQTGSSLEYNSQEPNLSPSNVVTHAVGLAGQRQLAKAAGVQQQQPQWRISECQSDCDGPLIGFFVRLIMLAVAHWAIFFRPQTATLPRVDFQRCLLISLALLITTAYWLFFVFRVFDKRYNDFELHYMTIVQFSISMLETLILLHYLALVIIELRHRKRVYCLKVVRSPDGESKYYSCGLLSIQKCAQFVLEKYHRDFNQFNSYKERLLAYEDELAHHLKRQRQAQNQDSSNETTTGVGGRRGRRSSRPSSPRRTNHHDDELEDETEDIAANNAESHEASGGRSASRRSRRRHHHRRHHSTASRMSDENEDNDDDEADPSGRSRDRRRSPSRSPSRSRRSTRQLGDTGRPNESLPDEQRSRRKRSRGGRSSDDDDDYDEEDHRTSSPSGRKTTAEQKQRRAETNKTNAESADQSSDTTSRLKESSLETIRAANVGPDKNQAMSTTTATATSAAATTTATSSTSPANNNNNKADIEISERPRHQQQTTRSRLDETESVRSARSRRSTGSRMHRSHRNESSARHHSARHPRERSSSRAARAHTMIEVEPNEPESNSAELADEHERKLRRRKLRLLAAIEDSFEQVRLLDEGPLKPTTDQAGCLNGPAATRQTAIGLDAGQAARTLYPSIARPLQKYLKLTKQTGRHNLQSIYEHLAKCLLYKLSARTFLEKFTSFDPVWQQNETNLFAGCRLFGQMGPSRKPADREPLQLNSWSLICDTLLSRQIDSGTFFVLNQGQVSLLVSVAKLPHWNLTEQVIDPSSCRFSYGPNPETTSV